jgi:hypothetical protein
MTEVRKTKEDWGKKSLENPNEKSDELVWPNDDDAPVLDGSKLTKKVVSIGSNDSTSQDPVVLDSRCASAPPFAASPGSHQADFNDLGPFSSTVEDDGLSDADTSHGWHPHG